MLPVPLNWAEITITRPLHFKGSYPQQADGISVPEENASSVAEDNSYIDESDSSADDLSGGGQEENESEL